jgi:Asp-tRNA(Asn)/Glu-tRNA(Gln) amidotransferase A subunit family amidase
MARVGILGFSDGREFVHSGTAADVSGAVDELASALEAMGHSIVRAEEPIWTNDLAVREARRVADGNPSDGIRSTPELLERQLSAYRELYVATREQAHRLAARQEAGAAAPAPDPDARHGVPGSEHRRLPLW